MIEVETRLGEAVRQFWRTRSGQKRRQGRGSGAKDTGSRAAVTGGKHADGFIKLIAEVVRDAGLPNAVVHASEKMPRTLPGWYRPTKEWDLVVISGKNLVAVVEVKS